MVVIKKDKKGNCKQMPSYDCVWLYFINDETFTLDKRANGKEEKTISFEPKMCIDERYHISILVWKSPLSCLLYVFFYMLKVYNTFTSVALNGKMLQCS